MTDEPQLWFTRLQVPVCQGAVRGCKVRLVPRIARSVLAVHGRDPADLDFRFRFHFHVRTVQSPPGLYRGNGDEIQVR
jgi:hypothetical protein